MNGTTAGCALRFPTFDPYRGQHTIYIESLCIRPEWRGHGLGRTLLTTVAEEGTTQGYAAVEWSVLRNNTRAIKFYQTQGATSVADLVRFRLATSP